MADVLIPALECPHTHFDLKLTPGHGYELHCPDCGVCGTSSPIANIAVGNFERAVKRARAAERREHKKLHG